MAISRREFVARGAAGASLIAAAGPFAGFVARAAGAPMRPTVDAGYGPLVPTADATTGETLLSLPRGFRYRTFGETGSTMLDGLMTPTNHDGMEAYPGPRGRGGRKGRIRLVRNHETWGPGLPGRPLSEFGIPSGDPQGATAQPGTNPYDPTCRGGTTTIEVDMSGHPDRWGEVTSWVSLSGTYMNCSGGASTYGTWFSCEESPSGPDLGSTTTVGRGGDLFGNGRWNLPLKHGYIFEVDAAWGPGELPSPTPITQAGRLTHEGALMDPATGYLYETEDNWFGPSGLYRYLPPNDPQRDRRVEDGGTLQMLRVVGIDQAALFEHQEPGATYAVDWVTIDDPDPSYAPGTTWVQSLGDVADQGIAKGAARFSRLEGIRRRGRRLYVTSTQGGQGREGASSTFGPGFGQIWTLDLASMTLQLVFEAPPRPDPTRPVGPDNLPALNLPDNIAISPKGSLVICEDGTIDSPSRGYVIPSNFVRGLSRSGELFDFAENISTSSEVSGAAFSPDGRSLFFNMQNAGSTTSPGRTFEVRGPFHRGPW